MGGGPTAGVSIRREEPSDAAGVRRVNLLAFDSGSEADIVERLRAAGAVTLSLVAEVEGDLVGHLLCSPVTVEEPRQEEPRPAVGLGPMAVVPGHQRRGVGSRLVRECIAELGRLGHRAIVLIGHPGYYPRFGFVPARRFGLETEFDVPEQAFLALELRPGALAGGGLVRYRTEFTMSEG